MITINDSIIGKLVDDNTPNCLPIENIQIIGFNRKSKEVLLYDWRFGIIRTKARYCDNLKENPNYKPYKTNQCAHFLYHLAIDNDTIHYTKYHIMFDKKVNSLFSKENSENLFVKEGLKVSSECTSTNGAKKYSTSGDDFVDNFVSVSRFQKPQHIR